MVSTTFKIGQEIENFQNKHGVLFSNKIIAESINGNKSQIDFYDFIVKETLNSLNLPNDLKTAQELLLNKKCSIEQIDDKSNLKSYKEASFVAIVAKTELYKDYECESMSDYDKNRLYDICLMFYRWDGKIGFIGGFNDNDEINFTVFREAEEEIGLQIDRTKLKFLCSHKDETSKVISHLNVYDLGVINIFKLKELLIKSAFAKHYATEGNLIITNLETFKINSNILCPMVKEEFEILKEFINNKTFNDMAFINYDKN